MVGDVPEGRPPLIAEPLLRLRLQVRFSDCDPLGHVNNAVYLTYLEQARIVLWRHQLGVQLGRTGDSAARGERFILARAEIDFKSQAFDGDDLEVRLSLAGFGRSTATYEYEIVDVPTGRLIASARTVQVWYDYDARRSVAIDDELKQRLTQIVRTAFNSPS